MDKPLSLGEVCLEASDDTTGEARGRTFESRNRVVARARGASSGNYMQQRRAKCG